MKKLFIIILSLASLTAFAQTNPNKVSLAFDDFVKFKNEQFANVKKQLLPQVKEYFKQDSLQRVFFSEFLQYKSVDFTRISTHTDSLKITDKGIELIYRKEKNK